MIRVLIADDQALVCQALAALLQEKGCEVVGQAYDGRGAVSLCRKLKPHIILLDSAIAMSQKIIPRIRACAPDTRILVLSMQQDPEEISKAMELGAHGYVMKMGPAEQLFQIIRLTLSGKSQPPPQRPSLTARERECLRLIAQGLSSSQIAQKLGISPKTVEAHRTRLMEKLNIHSVAGLTHYALAKGLINPLSI